MDKVNGIRVLWSTLCNSIHYLNGCSLPVVPNLAQGGVYQESLIHRTLINVYKESFTVLITNHSVLLYTGAMAWWARRQRTLRD